MLDRVGVCTWIFGPIPLADAVGRVADLGADGVELHADLGGASVDEVRRLLDDHALEVYSLTPPQVDVATPVDEERRAAIDAYLRLVDVAAALGRPVVGCHGLVSRAAAIGSRRDELALLTDAVRRICDHATRRDVRVVFEVLNRYESHLVTTCEQALALVDAVGSDALGVLLDAYHMNVDEADPVAALQLAGERLWLYHVADSNREAIGRGHVDVGRQLDALRAIEYAGPIIVECTAPGPNPFTAEKGPGYLEALEMHVRESVSWLRRHAAGTTSRRPPPR